MEPSGMRRSATNLHHLSLAPLSSRLPLDSEEEEEGVSPYAHSSSYIAGKSAPTTPGILSRSPSVKRLGSSGKGASAGNAGSKSFTNLRQAAAALASPGGTIGGHPQPMTPGGGPNVNKRLGHRYSRSASSAKIARDSMDSSEWLLRAGAAITSEARESKGQAWLVSRESSTSLVQARSNIDYDDDVDIETKTRGIGTPINNRSRRTSRVNSARTSRRTSRVGSRTDLAAFGGGGFTPAYTPAGGRTPAVGLAGASGTTSTGRGGAGPSSAGGPGTEEFSYFNAVLSRHASAAAQVSGPDFVDEISDGEMDDLDDTFSLYSDYNTNPAFRADDAEVARLARSERGFGLGAWMDTLIEWTLFSVKEDGEESEDEHEIAAEHRARRQRRRAEALKKLETLNLERERSRRNSGINTPSGMLTPGLGSMVRLEEVVKEKAPADEEVLGREGGTWKDVGWLLSIASKVVL